MSHVVKPKVGEKKHTNSVCLSEPREGTTRLMQHPPGMLMFSSENTMSHAMDIWENKTDTLRNTPKLEKDVLPRGSKCC